MIFQKPPKSWFLESRPKKCPQNLKKSPDLDLKKWEVQILKKCQRYQDLGEFFRCTQFGIFSWDQDQTLTSLNHGGLFWSSATLFPLIEVFIFYFYALFKNFCQELLFKIKALFYTFDQAPLNFFEDWLLSRLRLRFYKSSRSSSEQHFYKRYNYSTPTPSY